MKKLFLPLLVLALFSCGTPQPVVDTSKPSPTPTVSPTLHPSPTPTPIPCTTLYAPGYGVFSQWKWTPNGVPSQKLKDAVAVLKTPQDIATYLYVDHEWNDQYDISEFISPNQFVDGHKSVCTGFARFWVYALAQQGIHADFVAIYGPNFGHAVALFKSPADNEYHMGSNQSYYGDGSQNLDPFNKGRNEAIINTAKFFLNDTWYKIEVYDENGHVIETYNNPKNTTTITITTTKFNYRY